MDDVDYGEVMHKFYAGRQYGVRGPNYEDITWLETEAMPTKEYLAQKWVEIRESVLSKRVAMQRAAPGNYPHKDDMLVALWEMIVEDRPLSVLAIQEQREAIKAQFPKPV